MNRGAFLAGLLFTAIGLSFLLDRLEIWDVSSEYVWPVMLIVLGVVVLLTTRGRRDETPPP